VDSLPRLALHAALRQTEAMSDPRLIHIDLDQGSIIHRNADIEQERRIAIFDLLEENYFRPERKHEDGYEGPFRLTLSVHDGRLVMDIAREDSSHFETIVLGMARFQRPIREYFAICDSYFQAVKQASAQHIETVDMARRGIHNDASDLLKDRLAGKVDVDFDTARRLFTLICVLHIKG
jgi:uncharacterized protein (UPF0262 family)